MYAWALRTGSWLTGGQTADPTARTVLYLHIVSGCMRDLPARLYALDQLLNEQSPLVEQDGARGFYLDLSGCDLLLGPASEVARRLISTARTLLALDLAGGIGTNKCIARLAAQVAAPGTVQQVAPEHGAIFIAPFDLALLPDLLDRQILRLAELGVTTIGQLVTVPEWMLRALLGSSAITLRQLALGYDLRPVRPSGPDRVRRLLHEERFQPTLERAVLRRILVAQLAELCYRVRKLEKAATTVAVGVEFVGGSQVTRQKSLPHPLDAEQTLIDYAWALLDSALLARRQQARTLALSLHGLVGAGTQLSLLPTLADQRYLRYQQLNRALDRLRERYGELAVLPGRHWALRSELEMIRWASNAIAPRRARPARLFHILGGDGSARPPSGMRWTRGA